MNHEALQAAADYVNDLRRQLDDLSRLNTASRAAGLELRFDKGRLRAELELAQDELETLRRGPGGDLAPPQARITDIDTRLAEARAQLAAMRAGNRH